MRHVLLGGLLMGFFGGVAFGYSNIGHATLELQRSPEVAPFVLSGQDIGFRMTGRRGDKAVGTLVVKVDGEWREVEFGHGARPATDK